ncbi:bestrophin family ion channel [Gemmata sp.]|uniref:bestrophin family ion channel n=1 Tax=Gemmata sp. TaxID=1914242 RepID=UPI003F70AB1B
MPEPTLKRVRRVFRFPVLGRLWKYLVAVGVYSAVVVQFGPLLDAGAHRPTPRAGEMIIAGILFGWLMSFRTQTSYSRWWDGRGLWGQLVNDSRNLVLKAAAYVDDPVERAKLNSVVVRFAETLRDRLRLPARNPGPHLPMAAAGEVFQMIRRWQAEGKVDGFAFLALDRHGLELMNICGACEKIRATPLAASYRGLLRKGIVGYLLLLPWLMYYETGWATVAVCVLTAYALVGLELIASSIEDPFGYDGDDLPLDEIVETVRRASGYSPPA